MSDQPLRVILIALPETAGSVLYGMIDVLSATGTLWETLMREQPRETVFEPLILSTSKKIFDCGNRIPVRPDVSVANKPSADIVIVPELWLGPDETLEGRYETLKSYIREQYAAGAYVYSACSGSILLAETGLLDGKSATSHWGYQDLFRQQYPEISFRPEPNLCFADESGRLVTAGGTTSWHDLVLHIISRHASPIQAARIKKVYLLKWHDEGQLPYNELVRKLPHDDKLASQAEAWLEANYQLSDPVSMLVDELRVPERTLKRRFKQVTGSTLIQRVQDLRVEHAKRLLETERTGIEHIAVEVGYEDAAFFRRLFRRSTGVSPSEYRRMFRPSELSHLRDLVK